MKKYCDKADEQMAIALKVNEKKRQNHNMLHRLYLHNGLYWSCKLNESIGKYGLDIEVRRKMKSFQFNYYAKNGGVFN